jgi:PAS domain S-box-containing protein
MNKINILIVDDKEENIIALEALIKSDDVELLSTTSPNMALKLAWENDISIALVDVQMPGMDGFELVEMLKSNPRTKDILVIFITAISKESKFAARGLSVGAIDYLYKPLDPIITTAKVDSFVLLAKTQLQIKQKNIELAKSEVIIANSSDIICLVNAQTKKIEKINPAVQKILGFKQDDLLGKSINVLIPDRLEENFSNKLADLVNLENDNKIFEFKLLNFIDEEVWTECRITFNNNNFFINISDHTLQKKHEEDLISSKEEAIQARNVKERFLANMSHELRTPLNGIIGISNLLKQTVLEDAQKEMIKLLEVSSQSLLGVVNDILDISKIDSGKLNFVKREVKIRHLLKSTIELLRFKADEKLIQLTLDVEDNIPTYLEVDPLRFNQILMNLLSNSLKFTDKGFIKVEAKLLSKKDDLVEISFKVIDTGIGIKENRHKSIFESYEQADEHTAIKYGGTGLGLGIVKKLVELHEGRLTFKSTYGEGSEFEFILPLKLVDSEISSDSTLNKELQSFKGIKALVAEDNLINQFMISKVLNKWGIEADIVEDGQLVLDKLGQLDYDFILMDTHMPNLGGYETTRIIRADRDEIKRNIAIVSMSAAVLEEERKAAMDAGMNYVLTKPFIPEDLHRIISKIVFESIK